MSLQLSFGPCKYQAGLRRCCALLGGSWVVISGVISRVTIVITQIRGLITPLITTHEPPSRLGRVGFEFWGSTEISATECVAQGAE